MIATEYGSYLEACNRRDWVKVKSYFGPAVVVNDQLRSIEHFIGDLVRLCLEHPDHRWTAIDVREAGHIVTACLETSQGSDQGVEFVQYRSAGSMIVQVWSIGSSPS